MQQPINDPLVQCKTDGCKVSTPLSKYDAHVLTSHMNKPKHAGGRPCEFCSRKAEILKLTRSYLDSGKGDKPRMLYLNELAMNLGGYRDIILEWKAKRKTDGSLEHPEFSDMVKELESMQEFRLQQRLMGRFNPTGAIFLLKTKHKYIETEKQIMAGDKSEPLRIEFIPEKPIPDNE